MRNPHLVLSFLLFLSLASNIDAFSIVERVSSSRRNQNVASYNQQMSRSVTSLHLFDQIKAATSLSTTTSLSLSNAKNIASAIIENPVTWSVAIMGTIVGLLFIWEELIETAREKIPSVVESVIDQVLAEIGSLGFIGLLLDAVLHQPWFAEGLEHVSEHFLGDGELLLETFEFLHQVFFQTAVLFFAGAAILLVRVLSTLRTVAQMADDAVAAETEICVTKSDNDPSLESILNISTSSCHDAQDLIPILLLDEAARQSRKATEENVWKREASLSLKQRGAEAVIIRDRLIREMNLEGSFRISDYLENGVFSASSEENGGEEDKESKRYDFLKISPTVWVPLIPSIALANSLDLSHDVVNSERANAVASSGYFLSTPWVFIPTLLTQVATLIWGLTNFWKMAVIKQMLLPGLVEEQTDTGYTKVVLCPPNVEDEILRKEFATEIATPGIAKPFETNYVCPPTNRVEELYGVVGANGRDFYFNSIKLHLWKCATGWIAFSQILPRDLYALSLDSLASDMIGAPEYLTAEIIVFGLFALLDLIQVIYLVPTTVLNYCIVTTVQDFVAKEKETDQTLIGAEPQQLA